MFEKLKETRAKKRVTCEELSILIGLKTRSSYHEKESGQVPFTLVEAKVIADYFEVSVDSLFFESI